MSLALCLLSAFLGSAQAQLTINAEVDKTHVTLDDQIVLTVTVSGPESSLPEPRMTPQPNFSVYSSGRNQSISFINGKVSSSIVYTYVMVPHFVGKGTIGPIAIAAEGAQAQTAPIEITVERPGGAPPGAPGQPAAPPQPRRGPAGPRAAPEGAPPDVFVTAVVDKSKAFVNEQVTLTIKFFTAVSLLGNPQYDPPKIAGFLSEDLPPARHGNMNFRGRQYYYSEIKTALFPAQAGRLTIGPATVRCQVQQDAAVDPFAPDFFQKFFAQGGGSVQTRELRSEPIIVTAEKLPDAGKPEDFSGAVGRFGIAAAVDRARAKVGEAVSLSVTVQGEGNLKAIADPRLPETPSMRIYDTVSSLNMDKKDDRVRGSKVFKTLLMPRVSGDLAIPALSFTYFDPAKRAYARAAALPIALKIAPAEPGSAPAAGLSAPGGGRPQGLTSVSSDIRYLKTRGGPSAAAKALEALAGGGMLNFLPLLVFAASLGLVQYREYGSSDPKGARFRGAYRAAAAKLKEAARASDPHRAAALLGDAFSQYLADKLGQAASGLTARRAQELLRLRRPSASEPLIERVKAAWDELDLRRFAPSAQGAAEAELAQTLAALLGDLEKELKR